jgi:hypothetical protein
MRGKRPLLLSEYEPAPLATLSALVLLAYKNIFARGGIRAKQGPARSDPVRDKDLT